MVGLDKKEKLILMMLAQKHFRDKQRRHQQMMNNLLMLLHRRLTDECDTPLSYWHMLLEITMKNSPSVWAYQRDENWFDFMWKQRIEDNFEDGRWKSDFRMNGKTFSKLVVLLTPFLSKQVTRCREPIPVEKRVAVALWRLTTGDPYRSVAERFAVGKSTAVMIVREFCESMGLLAGRYIQFPQTPSEVREAISKFKEDFQCELPQAFCAVSGTHIEILAPVAERKDRYLASSLKRYTINSQVIVGANLMFLDVATGFPGSTDDGRMWRASSVGKALSSSEGISNYPEGIFEGVPVKPIIIGDNAYPLGPQLMKPYLHSPSLLTRELRKFNRVLLSARSAVERGIGVLKARYRILQRRLDSNVTSVSDIIIACAVLHNFCIMNDDIYEDENGILDQLLRMEASVRSSQRRAKTVHSNGTYIREILRRHVNS